MNTPFKEHIAWMPDFIGEELMNQQEEQGNKRDITVFEKIYFCGKHIGGFDWRETKEGQRFWQKVLDGKDINLFLAWFKPELEVWDNYKNKHIATCFGYDKNRLCPILAEPEIDESGSVFWEHAQLPKKNTTEKENLLKKADELLTMAAEMKEAAEKL